MCLDEFGRISIEVRRESFIIHTEYGHDEAAHPEFNLSDLDDLIAALEDARDYLKRRKR